MKKKILILAGTRPEIVKIAPVIQELSESKLLEGVLCVTGQHSSMLQQALDAFDLKPEVNLAVMTEKQSLETLTSKIVLGASSLIRDISPSAVLVHGDTTTTMASALAAIYNQIPVGHIEAGLRTHNIASPFPEEINRQIVARLASWNFVPTEVARENLLREGVTDSAIFVTGNTVVDSIRIARAKIDSTPTLSQELRLRLIQRLGGKPMNREFVLFTAHRRENFGKGIDNLCHFLTAFADEYPNLDVLFPVHPNPQVSDEVKVRLATTPSIHLVEPMAYMDLIYALSQSKFVITDSGGIQEEAVSLGKHVVITRELTERGEGASTGLMHLVGTNPANLLEVAHALMGSPEPLAGQVFENPYGDGHAAARIVETLEKALA